MRHNHPLNSANEASAAASDVASSVGSTLQAVVRAMARQEARALFQDWRSTEATRPQFGRDHDNGLETSSKS